MRLTRTLVRLCGALAATFMLSLVFSAAQMALAVSPNVVISQMYGGAGWGTAGCSTSQKDFTELFNRGTTPVSINGWSVQDASAGSITGSTQVTPLAQGAGINLQFLLGVQQTGSYCFFINIEALPGGASFTAPTSNAKVTSTGKQK